MIEKFINNPHSNFHRVFCIDKNLTPDELEEYYHHLEKELGINLHAHDITQTKLHGFITTTKPSVFCEWGNHSVLGEHTSIIVSLHTNAQSTSLENVQRILGNTHTLHIVNPQDYEEKMIAAHQKFVKEKEI